MKPKTCPNCDGTGAIEVLYNGDPDRPGIEPCQTCNADEHIAPPAPLRTLTRMEQLQGLADSGIDTWAELRGER